MVCCGGPGPGLRSRTGGWGGREGVDNSTATSRRSDERCSGAPAAGPDLSPYNSSDPHPRPVAPSRTMTAGADRGVFDFYNL